MIEFLIISCFISILIISGYYFLTANAKNDKKNNGVGLINDFLCSWKVSLLIWVILLILFFIYYSSLLYLFNYSATYTDVDGNIIAQYSNNTYMLGFQLLKIVITIIYVDTAVLIWRIFNQTNLLIKIFG